MLDRLRRALPLPSFESFVAQRDLRPDVLAALTVVFLGVPQGMAYATVAHLPPVVGLYASALPVIVSSLLRSSRHVIAGPSNALSLLVGAGVAAGVGPDPLVAVVTLAALVGVFQLAAGVLRLGALVDYISSSVVLGYVTGAGVLIGVGQLYNATGTAGETGTLWVTVPGVSRALADTQPLAVGVAVATVVLIALTRRFAKKVPAAVLATAAAIAVTIAFDLDQHGLKTARDIAPIPAGLPPFTLPDLSLVRQLLPLAIACSVLSLIEANAVARSLAQHTGDRVDASVEFTGQGLANIVAGLSGGYPISGSLARSTLNYEAGAHTRLAGVLTGAFMVVVLLALGPVLESMPVAALAGLLFVVAWRLVDVRRIRAMWGAGWTDRLAFGTTLIGTWTLPLDDAIYLGVGVSIVLFLRKARLITMREVAVSEDGALLEQDVGTEAKGRVCPRVRILQLQGSLFFGAANELLTTLDDMTRDDQLRTLVVRLRRTSGLDGTVAAVFASAAERMRARGQRLVLVGVSERARRVLDGAGATELIGEENVRPMGKQLLVSLREVIDEATADACKDCETCPLLQFPEP